MIDLETVVQFVLYLLLAGVVFGLLFWLITYLEREFPGGQPFFRFARIAVVVLGVLVVISIVLSLAGHPVVRWGPRPL